MQGDGRDACFIGRVHASNRERADILRHKPRGWVQHPQEIPPNLTNPICICTSSNLEDKGSTKDSHSGTNDSFPIPLDQSVSREDVQSWCPWDLQLDTPSKPGDGVYTYPDNKIKRPVFNPCYSACAKFNKASDCCTGKFNDPDVCKASTYSKGAKKVCPDAYSFGKCFQCCFPCTPSTSLQPHFH